jgi:hypothetical protein
MLSDVLQPSKYATNLIIYIQKQIMNFLNSLHKEREEISTDFVWHCLCLSDVFLSILNKISNDRDVELIQIYFNAISQS